MKSLVVVGIIGITLTVGALVVIVILCVIDCFGTFEYITLNGEKGTASYCTVSYGSAHCSSSDGTNIIVESFRKIK